MIKYIILMLMLYSTIVTANPLKLYMLENDSWIDASSDISQSVIGTFYRSRHADSLLYYKPIPAEKHVINTYIKKPESVSFTYNTYEDFQEIGPDLYNSIYNLPNISSAETIDHVQVGRGLGPNVGEYVVSHGKPSIFSENPDYIINRIGNKLGQSREDSIIVYRVNGASNPKSLASFIEASEEAPVVYNYGSAFRVTNIIKHKIPSGNFANREILEVKLSEVDEVAIGAKCYDIDGEINGVSALLTNTELSNVNIPKDLQVKIRARPTCCN